MWAVDNNDRASNGLLATYCPHDVVVDAAVMLQRPIVDLGDSSERCHCVHQRGTWHAFKHVGSC